VGTSVWVTANGIQYAIVDDGVRIAQAVAVGRVVDELSDTPPSVRVEIDWPHLWVTTPGDGTVCIAGKVDLAFPALATTAYDVPVVVHVEGGVDLAVVVHVPAAATFPIPIVLPPLRRVTVRLQGRVVEQPNPAAGIAGARVVAVDDPSPPAPLVHHALVLRTPLRFGHDVPTPVRGRALGAPGAASVIAESAAPDADTVTLSTRAGLAVGALLRIGEEASCEFAVIRALPPVPVNPALPGPVQLWGGLLRGAAVGTPVSRIPLGGPGPVTSLARASARGDGLALLVAHIGGEVVEVDDANPDHVEYAAIGALTDAQGYYRVDGIGRVRTCFFRASHAAWTDSPPTPCSLDLDRPATLLNFRLKP
jgi:hypothetical protein